MSSVRKCEVLGCEAKGQHKGAYRKDGTAIRGKLCTTHHNEKYGMQNGKYTRYKKTYCEFPGCTVRDTVFGTSKLQVDHKDGDRTNNSPYNLQTLCYEHHKDKTSICKDWQQSSYAKLPGY